MLVEHYANDNCLKKRLIRFMLTDPKTSKNSPLAFHLSNHVCLNNNLSTLSSGERWRLFIVFLKLASCLLYVIRVEGDDDPQLAGW